MDTRDADNQCQVWLVRDGLVIVAGLPGAGKSTVLRAAENRAGARVLDSDEVRSWLRARMPSRVRYRWYRPLVHLVHRARIAWYAACGTGPLVAHEPATRASTRALLVTIAVLARRPRHFVWISATAVAAARGQSIRGRMLHPRRFARHVSRARRVERALAGHGLRGWDSVQVCTPSSRLVLRRAEAEAVDSASARLERLRRS